MEALASFFKFHERGTSVGTEIRAGVTTFLVMVYIVAVNPAIIAGPWVSTRWRLRREPRSWPGS